MLSPIAFTLAPFESLTHPKEIYEISIQSLVSSSDQVSSFAYKKVAHRVKPVATTLPEDFRIICCIPSNPLETLPLLPFHPPDFIPGLRYTLERKLAMNIISFCGQRKRNWHIILLNSRSLHLPGQRMKKGSFHQITLIR